MRKCLVIDIVTAQHKSDSPPEVRCAGAVVHAYALRGWRIEVGWSVNAQDSQIAGGGGDRIDGCTEVGCIGGFNIEKELILPRTPWDRAALNLQ